MGILRELCVKYTVLTDSEIMLLESVEKSLPFIADLTGSDVFIDIFDEDTKHAVVAAQARPQFGTSRYDRLVVGMPAKQQDEPAVYRAAESGTPVHDLRAVTQEGCIVRQDVTPICQKNRLVGVLICEKDISRSVQKERKYDAMARRLNEYNDRVLGIMDETSFELAEKESRHRIKNSLQMVASMLSLEARCASDMDIRYTFEKNANRVRSVAMVHDLLTKPGKKEAVSLKEFFRQLISHMEEILPSDKEIEIQLTGDDMDADFATASSAALVVNELITNAIQHAFNNCSQGCIQIALQKGGLDYTITVEDNGSGCDGEDAGQSRNHLGIDLMRRIAEDKLKGDLYINMSPQGTKAVLQFKLPG